MGGAGPSLQRKIAEDYGNDPINWDSAPATPGRPNTTADSDGDGMPDSWELAHGTSANTPDADTDADQDGRTNLEEYIVGSHPNDASSEFRVRIQARSVPTLEIDSVVGRLYTLQCSEQLPPSWINIRTNQGTGSMITISLPSTDPAFYRVRVNRF